MSELDRGHEAYMAKDYESARQHWIHPAETGNGFAMNNLGYLLYYGLGGPADPDRAVELWRQAALNGVSEAQWHLGIASWEGKGTPKSAEEAYAWLRCAVANAEATAERTRSLMHRRNAGARNPEVR